MKGTTWNGDYFASKGCTRSEAETMFSVGNTVAFSYSYYCSPDGRSYSYGCVPSQNSYLLQEEIVLEEYDDTESDRYGSGSYDIKKIIELKDVFWHRRETPIIEKTFLLQILEHDKNVFPNDFIAGDIAEVRNHPGKFLHIYEIPEGYRECKGDTFAATVAAINLQKEQEDAAANKAVTQNYRGVEMVFGITSPGYYESWASFGKYSVQLAHEYDITRRNHATMVISKECPSCATATPDGWSGEAYQFYWDGTPMSLTIFDNGRHPEINTLTQKSWCNSQNWGYERISTLNIKEKWIFINGKDVFHETKERISGLINAEKTARKNKFEELSKTVTEKYGEEVLKIALKKKGQVLAVLTTLANSQSQLDIADIKKILQVAGGPAEIANLMAFISAGIFPGQAEKVAKKAYAWAYLYDAFPGVAFAGDFDDARSALEKYSKTWKPKVSRATFLLGDLDSFRKLRNKLA